MAQRARHNPPRTQYAFSNITDYREQKMYNVQDIGILDSKIAITKDNVVDIMCELQSFNDQ